jgi:hypothetical protein
VEYDLSIASVSTPVHIEVEQHRHMGGRSVGTALPNLSSPIGRLPVRACVDSNFGSTIPFWDSLDDTRPAISETTPPAPSHPSFPPVLSTAGAILKSHLPSTLLFAQISRTMTAIVPWRSATAFDLGFSTDTLILATDPPLTVTTTVNTADDTTSQPARAIDVCSTKGWSKQIITGSTEGDVRCTASSNLLGHLNAGKLDCAPLVLTCVHEILL